MILTDGRIDYLDMSLWDVAKEPMEAEFQGRSLMSHFTALDRGQVRLGVAGKVTSPAVAREMLAQGAAPRSCTTISPSCPGIRRLNPLHCRCRVSIW